MLAAEIIRAKREGDVLPDAQIEAFVRGLVDRSWSDAQAGAMAMAICLKGMNRAETVALTRAMTDSGERLSWADAKLAGPVLDKHSTGGVGDKVSLLLAPIVAACGGVVPMISGRGLGHTGGTLDKLEALPGYQVTPRRATLLRTLREAGCAIVGASAKLAPADARLYAIRDVTATVESLPLITASILSKKLAAGLQGLVMDVKVGNGAFCRDLESARALAASITEVAKGAGLPTRALITDMNQVLGTSAGNAVEVQEAIDALTEPKAADARLIEVTLALSADLLQLGGIVKTLAEGDRLARAALDSGRAAERFERMVARLGGPAGVLKRPQLPVARWRVPVPAPERGVIEAVDTRALALAIVALGGGRTKPGDTIDPRIGLTEIRPPGTRVRAGEPLARLHVPRRADADAVLPAIAAAFRIGQSAPAPLLHAVIE
jgi:thymidine phosphorylase